MDGNFHFLNRDNRWADFTLHGLQIAADGAVVLVPRPLLRTPVRREESQPEPEPAAPSGVAATADGTVFFADPLRHRILRIDACDDTWTPAVALGGEGRGPSQFIEPRGIAFHAPRARLLVADSGNDRVQVFDARSLQFVAAWQRTREAGAARDDDAQLRQPWSLACDPDGNVYVVDYGARRIHKFEASGRPRPEFSYTLHAEVFLSEPTEVAVGVSGGLTDIYILDARARKIVVVDAEGHHRRSFALRVEQSGELATPMGLAVADDALYVGDNGQRRVYTYALDGTFAGPALGFEGTVTGLGIAPGDRLLVHQGSSAGPVRLERRGGFGRSGIMWGGPFRNLSTRSDQLHRLTLLGDFGAPGAHLAVHVYSGRDDVAPPVGSANTRSFESPPWTPLPPDVSAGVFPGAPLDLVWIGIELSSEGLTSPRIEQARLDFDHESYVPYLPAVYREDAGSRELLTRFLSIFEGLFDGVESEIRRLPELYDPQAARAGFLSWLAGWFALTLKEAWPESQKRQAIADAFTLYARRGTPRGLRDAVKFFLGVDVRIDEPIRHANWWVLPADDGAAAAQARASRLGVSTMLAPAEPLGAVVGATAVLDQSHLITSEEFGIPLFEDVAHTFSVQVYRGRSYSPAARQELQEVIEREKPAHTTYHLCVVEPRMRLGFQARLGIDTIVAGVTGPVPLGDRDVFVSGVVLGGARPGSIGARADIGRTATLGE